MNIIPQVSTSHEVISTLVDKISEDPFYSKVIQSRPFQRLKDISFLGAINYTNPCLNQKSIEKSRFSHSLWVAGLAKHISNKRNYGREIEKHIVTAALLHDVGHGPLSHSTEPVFKEKWGVGHHLLGKELIIGKQKISRDLSKILKQNLNVELVLSLIDGKCSEDFVDMFSSPINIDTIDGITRSYKYLMKGNNCHYNLLEIAEASLMKTKLNQENILDDFWKLKNNIYKLLIQSCSGYKADKICQIYFRRNIQSFKECDWFSNERMWKKKYVSLFKTLRSSKKLQEFDLVYQDKGFKMPKRNYIIDTSIKLENEISMKKRYICKKHEVNYTPHVFNNIVGKQSLLY